MLIESKDKSIIDPREIHKKSSKKKGDIKKINANDKNDIVERNNQTVITDDGRELLK
jgi:hypothetical protein